MSLSGSRSAEDINLDEFERRLRAAGAQQAGVEDPLTELARLLESSRLGTANYGAAPSVVDPAGAESDNAPPVKLEALRPTIDEGEELVPRDSEADREARQVFEQPPRQASGAEKSGRARSGAWKLSVSALALAGVAMIGAVVVLKGRAPFLQKTPPFIAAAQGPTKVQPPSDDTVSSHDPGASLLKDNANPAAVKVVNSEEQPVDLGAQTAPANAPSPTVDPGKSPAGGASTAPMLAAGDAPLVPMAAAAPPPPMASQFPDPKPVRTVSLRPDGTPIASITPPSSQGGGDAAPAAAAAPPPPKPAEPAFKPAPKTDSDAGGGAQPSTPKIELPTKLSPKSSARVVVPKTDTTAPEPTAQTPGEPTQLATAAKPDKPAKKPKSGQAVADATPTTPATPAAPPVDATASGGWAVQLAAPRSEAEAKSEMARLTGKYSADLNGSALGVHKAVVNGETIYRLRVVGLTKADAAALCARLKGDGGECFIAK